MWLWIAAAVLVAWGLARVFAGYPRGAAPGLALRRRERALIAAVADALYPPGGGIAESGREADVAGYIDRLVAASQPRQRVLMRALFFLFEHATLCFPAPGGPAGLRRFSSLSSSQREAVLESWRVSGLFVRRLCFTSLRALCTLGFFASPSVLRVLRLAPFAIETPVCEADLWYPPIGASRATLARGRATTPPSSGVPLGTNAPLAPEYAGTRR